MVFLRASDRRKDNLGKEDLAINVFGVAFREGFRLKLLVRKFYLSRIIFGETFIVLSDILPIYF